MLITVCLIFLLFILGMFMAIYKPHRGSLRFCLKDLFSHDESDKDITTSKVEFAKMNLIRLRYDVTRYAGLQFEDIIVGVYSGLVLVYTPKLCFEAKLSNLQDYEKIMWECLDVVF